MGLDIAKAVLDRKVAYSTENYNGAMQQEFIALSQNSVNAVRINDKEGYLKAKLRMHEIEFDLYPHLFGAKGKQKSYRKKYMIYYEAYYREMMEDHDYFSMYDDPVGTKLAQQLHFTTGEGKFQYVWDENFIAFLEHAVKKIDDTIEKTGKSRSLALHPEGIVVLHPEMMHSISLSGFVQAYDTDTAKKIIEHFHLQQEYFEIEPLNFSELHCQVCNALLKVPDKSKKIICENCGNRNNVEEKTINCLNCGGDFSPTDHEAACPHCGSVFQPITSVTKT